MNELQHPQPEAETPAETNVAAPEAAPAAEAPEEAAPAAEAKVEEAPAAEPAKAEETPAPAAEQELAAETAEMPDEEAVAAEVVEAEAAEAAEPKEPVTKAGLLDTLRTLATQDAADITAEELNRIKQQFYHLRNEEVRAAQEQWVADGNNADDFSAGIDPDEDTFRELMAAVKEKKAAARAALDEARAANLTRKREIIAELVEMSSDADNVNRHYNRARDLQAEFLAIGEVPDVDATAVWREYQSARELFYDQLKMNKELRDYDFKKNLADKLALVEEANALNAEEDVVAAFRRLQDLHDRWRRSGPVAKELREDLWTRFKDASAAVNKRYQAHFEERKAREAENEQRKTAICERLEALDREALRTFADWDAATKTFLEAQAEWRTLGFASRKSNTALFGRFRQLCDAFFSAKATYFKEVKEDLARNLRDKTALVEEAEALSTSDDWRTTTDRLVELQARWKTIGPVPKRNSEALWKRFQKACDTFFDSKKEATSGVRRTEQANLKLKQEIIDRLAAMTAPDAPVLPTEEAAEIIADLRAQWNEIGHVPFRAKDKVYDAFRDLLRAAEQKFDLRHQRRRMDNYRENVRASLADDPGRANTERRRLERQLEARRQDLMTYENNMGFLSFKSSGKQPGSNPLLRDMERRKEEIRRDIETLREKLRVLDDAENAPEPKPEAPKAEAEAPKAEPEAPKAEPEAEPEA